MVDEVLAILKKEMRRIFTDRRLLFMLVVLPLVMLPLMYSFMGRAGRSRQSEISAHRPAAAILVQQGSENAGDRLARGLALMNMELLHIGTDQLESVRAMITDKEMELLLVLPGEMDIILEESGRADLAVYHNSTGDYSRDAMDRLSAAVSLLNDSIVGRRIADAGLSQDILTAFTVNTGLHPGEYDLAGEGSLVGKVIGLMVPFFIVIYLFANSMKVGLDTVAGEKERGTLAVLLVNQVSRLSIVLGKMLAVMSAAIVGAVSSAVGLRLASGHLLDMFGEGGQTVSEYSMVTTDFILFGIAVIPLAILISCIVLLVSTFARNVKEGQGLIMPVYVAVMVLGMVTMQASDVPPGWMRIAPVVNSLVVMRDVFMKNAALGDILFSMATSLFLAGVLVFLTLRMFNDERILFRL